MTGIYAVKNRLNEKIYIGKCEDDFDKRFREHKRGFKSNIHLQRAFNKYGLENFDFIIIEECSPELCIQREMYWISYYKETKNTLYNIAEGGRGGNTRVGMTEEEYESYLEKIRRPRSEKFKQEQSKRFSGKNNPMYKKKITETTRTKLKARHIGKIWVCNGLEHKFVSNSEWMYYSELGYHRGMMHKCNKGATTIESIATEKSYGEK